MVSNYVYHFIGSEIEFLSKEDFLFSSVVKIVILKFCRRVRRICQIVCFIIAKHDNMMMIVKKYVETMLENIIYDIFAPIAKSLYSSLVLPCFILSLGRIPSYAPTLSNMKEDLLERSIF